MKKLILISALLFSFNGWAEQSNPCHQYYPNIPGELVLENDKLIVQRFIIQPGQWEGIHSHPGNQIYVHIKGGEWSGRIGGKSEYSAEIDEDGSVGWMDAIPLRAGHDSGNTGAEPIAIIYVTLKTTGCMDGN